MEWMKLPLGPIQTNCYIIMNEDRQCLIVDPGADGMLINDRIEKHSLKPAAIVLTHAHFDHIGGVDEVRKRWDIPLFVHEREAEWLHSPELNGSAHFPLGNISVTRPADELIKSEGTLQVKGFPFSILETPGHSPGSISLYDQKTGAVFAGDTLFAGSIGRTDLAGGNHSQLLGSIHRKLLALPEDTKVLPGHGVATTIGDEMDTNPFLNGFGQ